MLLHVASTAMALCGCRLDNSYDSRASATCQMLAEAEQQRSDAADMGALCNRCCATEGFENTDPEGCACGRIGLQQRLFGIER